MIPGIIEPSFLGAILDAVQVQMDAEGISAGSYKHLGGPRGTVGLFTKAGWTKMHYVNIANTILSQDPNIVTVMAELLGVNRLTTNFYEIKWNYPLPIAKRKHEPVLQQSHFEFIHCDCNLAKMLQSTQRDFDLQHSFYQIIVPLTPMVSNGATVFFANGSNRTWKRFTAEAVSANHWKRTGWQPCNPYNQWLPDGQHWIKDHLTPADARVGDIIVFDPTVIHAPIKNSFQFRSAAYIYLGPLLAKQDPLHPSCTPSMLPNSICSVQRSYLTGACPPLSAHPFAPMKIRLTAQHFYPTLPYYRVPLSELGMRVFGFGSWDVFEATDRAKLLFGYKGECFKGARSICYAITFCTSICVTIVY